MGCPRFVFSVIFGVFILPCQAGPGETLAERIVITDATALPISGTTAGRGVEPGEINEAAKPAGALDRSVWYEWAASGAGLALWKVNPQSGPQIFGLAGYELAPGAETVVMSNLVPAGSAIVPG